MKSDKDTYLCLILSLTTIWPLVTWPWPKVRLEWVTFGQFDEWPLVIVVSDLWSHDHVTKGHMTFCLCDLLAMWQSDLWSCNLCSHDQRSGCILGTRKSILSACKFMVVFIVFTTIVSNLTLGMPNYIVGILDCCLYSLILYLPWSGFSTYLHVWSKVHKNTLLALSWLEFVLNVCMWADFSEWNKM